jgi:DNA replication protein DnaC
MSQRKAMTIIEAGEQTRQILLVKQLQELRLTTFVAEYAELAQDAARANWSHEQYLATLTDHEVARRTQNRRQRRIQEARFPFLKELADFDFSAIPNLNQQLVHTLARGRYLQQAQPVIMVGAPGLGKTQPS